MRLLVLAALLLATPAHAAPAPGRVEFELLRNGQPDGRHVVEVTRTAGGLSVRSDVDIDVRLGPVSVFRYQQRCRETWADGALAALDCSTLKSGRTTRVTARQNENALIASAGGADARFPLATLPTTWWTKPPAFSGAMLNTETGEPMNVRITHLGRENYTLNGQTIPAERVRVQGTLTVDLWYDLEGRWIGCAFTARGQRIEYRLTSPRERAPEGFA